MKWLLVALIAGSFADFATTEIALGSAHISEANPLGQHRAARVALKVAGPVGVWYATKDLPKKWRIISCIAVSAAWGYVAYRNWDTYQRWR